MDYQDVEKVWKQRIGQKTADYEGEIVAITIQANEKIKQLEEENERLKSELVLAKNGISDNADEAAATS